MKTTIKTTLTKILTNEAVGLQKKEKTTISTPPNKTSRKVESTTMLAITSTNKKEQMKEQTTLSLLTVGQLNYSTSIGPCPLPSPFHGNRISDFLNEK